MILHDSSILVTSLDGLVAAASYHKQYAKQN
jgi:hypothetical protein